MDYNTNINHKKAAQYGSLLSGSLLSITVDNVDKTYKEKEGNKINRPIVPIKMYTISKIMISEAKLVPTPDNKVKVQYNGNPKLQFEIVDGSIPEPTAECVVRAIKEFAITGEPTVYFADYDKLFALVKSYNEDQITAAKALASDLMKQAGCLDDINTAEEAAYESYKASIRNSELNNIV